MNSVNTVHLIGRLGQEPDMRFLESGQAVTKLRLATDRPVRKGAQPQTDWHDVVCWGATAEFATEYLEKGRLVYVAGWIAYRTYETQEGERRRLAQIVAHEIVPLDRRPSRAALDEDVEEQPPVADTTRRQATRMAGGEAEERRAAA